MNLREQCIEAGRDALGRNDGWRWWAPRHLAKLFDLWEPLIRADEREGANRMVEAARSDANALWATACEEYGRCVPEESVRADEREAPPIGGLDVVRCWKMDMAHAEAVAARLVEVICEDAETIDGLRGALWDLAHVRGAVDEIVREEVARLRVESMDALTAERDAARAEVAALREQKPIGTVEWIESGMVPRARAETRREVLADLRAKVEGLPDESHMADSPGLIWRSEVLALIEEVDRG